MSNSKENFIAHQYMKIKPPFQQTQSVTLTWGHGLKKKSRWDLCLNLIITKHFDILLD